MCGGTQPHRPKRLFFGHHAARLFLKALPLLVVLLLPAGGHAQTEVDRFFIGLADSKIPVLPRQAREELVLLARGGSEPIVENLFAMPARLITRNDRYIKVSPTSSSRFEVYSLPTDSTPMICTIYTLMTPVPDSHITFYDLNGRELKNVFAMPDLEYFLTAPDSTIYLERKRWAETLVPLHIEAWWEDTGDVLNLKVHTGGLSMEAQKGAETAFKPLRLLWNRKQWQLLP